KARQKTITARGANTLLVQPGSAQTGAVRGSSGSMMTLTPEDADVIADRCRPYITDVAQIVRARTQLIYGNRNYEPNYIYGTTPNFLRVRDWEELDEGQMFTDQDIRTANQVCLIGEAIVRELFTED